METIRMVTKRIGQSSKIIVPMSGVGLLLLVLVCLQGCGFSTGGDPEALNPTNGIQATATRTPRPTETETPTLTPTPSPSFTPTSSPSATASPTLTHTPTPSPTLTGGGNGLVAIQDCLAWNDCQHAIFSLEDEQITPSDRPYLQTEVDDPNTHNYRLKLVDPQSGEKETVLACPEEFDSCHQKILLGSVYDEFVYIAQVYQERLYDGKRKSDLYRLNTTTWGANLIDQFEGSIFRFNPFPGSTRGLLSWYWSTGHGIKGELLIYDLETAQSQTLSQRNGQFLIFGASPDMTVFWFRISDYCRTELVASDDSRLAQIKDSDGIVGWIDADTFFIFTTANNPPICTGTGIAQANRFGLTGAWTTTRAASWALLTPGGEKVFLTSECNSKGCTQLLMANPDGTESQLLAESTQRSYTPSFSLSPDGSQYLFTWGGEIGVVNADGSDPQILLSTDGNWQVEGWLVGE